MKYTITTIILAAFLFSPTAFGDGSCSEDNMNEPWCSAPVEKKDLDPMLDPEKPMGLDR